MAPVSSRSGDDDVAADDCFPTSRRRSDLFGVCDCGQLAMKTRGRNCQQNPSSFHGRGIGRNTSNIRPSMRRFSPAPDHTMLRVTFIPNHSVSEHVVPTKPSPGTETTKSLQRFHFGENFLILCKIGDGFSQLFPIRNDQCVGILSFYDSN